MSAIHIETYNTTSKSYIPNCICVLGVLNNDRGIKIKNEMLQYLRSYYNVVACIQDAPGTLFEYPAISLACKLSTSRNTNILYIHTKGAGNAIPANYPITMMNSQVNYPSVATPQDCQRIVRLMWKKEFTTSKSDAYVQPLNTSIPTVTCPYLDASRITWQNAWMINPAAAKILNQSMHLSTNRYYYEQLFCGLHDIQLSGIILNDTDRWAPPRKKMWDSIWSYYDNTIATMI